MKMVATDTSKRNKLVIWPDKEDLKELNDMFLRAAITDKKLPKDSPRNITTAWLDMKKTWHDYGWDKSAKIKIRPSGEDLDNYDLEILHDMVDGNTIMQGLADAAEFEEITKKELGNYKRAFRSVIKKLNKIGEGHESFPIDPDNGMLYL